MWPRWFLSQPTSGKRGDEFRRQVCVIHLLARPPGHPSSPKPKHPRRVLKRLGPKLSKARMTIPPDWESDPAEAAALRLAEAAEVDLFVVFHFQVEKAFV